MALRINTPEQLHLLAASLGVRPDWHEPDEQRVTAVVRGKNFDNAGFWGREKNGKLRTFGPGHQETWVELFQDGQAVAEINLADLLAWASAAGG